MTLFNPAAWFAVCALCLLVCAAIAARSDFYRARLAESAASRYETLDGLRGFLAYAVLAGHAVNMRAFHVTGQWSGALAPSYGRGAAVGVALFFAITGFLFWTKVLRSGERFDTRALYLSRIRRLVPMYAVSVLMVFLVVGFLTGFRPQVSLGTLAHEARDWLSFGFMPTTSLNGVPHAHVIDAVYWTLAFEWMFYLALPILALFSRGRWFILLSAAVFFFGVQAPIVLNFFFGALAALIVHRRALEGRLGSRWLAPLPVLGLAGAYMMDPYSVPQSALLFVFLLFVVHGFDLFGLLRSAPAKVFGFLTYSVYLVHCIVLFVVFHAVHAAVPIDTLEPLQFWMLVAFSAAATVLLSALTYRYVEYPFINPQPSSPRGARAPARMQSA